MSECLGFEIVKQMHFSNLGELTMNSTELLHFIYICYLALYIELQIFI
jgi:hypothetical protein